MPCLADRAIFDAKVLDCTRLILLGEHDEKLTCGSCGSVEYNPVRFQGKVVYLICSGCKREVDPEKLKGYNLENI